MYSHNMSDPSNILSGFDPVLGIADGTTVGATYVVRQLFGGLTAFDSNIQEIHPSNTACPTWLLSLSGNLLPTVAVNSIVANLFIRFYFNDDPGLTASVPSCMVYKWKRINTSGTNRNQLGIVAQFAVSGYGIMGSTLDNGGSTTFLDYTVNTIIAQSLYYLPAQSSTTMSDFPSMILWKSNNVSMFMAVRKTDNAFVGGTTLVRPTPSGYTLTGFPNGLSGEMVHGNNVNTCFMWNSNAGVLAFEGHTNNSLENPASRGAELSWLFSIGKLPSIAFSLSGNLYIITAKLAGSYQTSNNQITLVSNEFDNIRLINTSIAANGVIILYNSTYWLVNGYVNDGNYNLRTIYQLSG